ncbi:hypothetical protein BYT27DRAFT_7194583 [Phlegmacium glaucopus]|nr:hypothetical protein BYT27DRAFT_7194583 [Phlegmacium glaucopus]
MFPEHQPKGRALLQSVPLLEVWLAALLSSSLLSLHFLLLVRHRQKRAAEAIVISSTPQPFNHPPLRPPSTTLDPSLSGGISHSQSPQITHMGSSVTYGTKGHIYRSIPSLTTNSYPVPPLQQSPLATINLLLSTLPPVSSCPSPLTLPSETNRGGGADCARTSITVRWTARYCFYAE